MKIAENDFRLDIRLIIFAFAVILQLFGTFEGISFLTPSKTGFMFGLTDPVGLFEDNFFSPKSRIATQTQSFYISR